MNKETEFDQQRLIEIIRTCAEALYKYSGAVDTMACGGRMLNAYHQGEEARRQANEIIYPKITGHEPKH